MNRRDAIKIMLFLCLLCASASAQGQAQGKRKIAVFVSGADSNVMQSRVIALALTAAISEGGSFTAASRTKEFTAAVEAERYYRRPGSGVDDAQLAKLGKKLGFSHVCAVGAAPMFYAVQSVHSDAAQTLLSAAIIETESATVVGSSYKIAALKDDAAVLAASQGLAKSLVDDFEKRGAGAVRGQVAVFLADEEDSGVGKVLYPLFMSVAAEYGVSERTNTLLEMLPASQRRSGHIEDEQLAKLGARSGAKFVMAIKVVSKIANVKIIDAASGGVVKSKTGAVDASSIAGVERSAKELAAGVLAASPAPLPPPPQAAAAPPAPPKQAAPGPPAAPNAVAEVDWDEWDAPAQRPPAAAPPPAAQKRQPAPVPAAAQPLDEAKARAEFFSLAAAGGKSGISGERKQELDKRKFAASQERAESKKEGEYSEAQEPRGFEARRAELAERATDSEEEPAPVEQAPAPAPIAPKPAAPAEQAPAPASIASTPAAPVAQAPIAAAPAPAPVEQAPTAAAQPQQQPGSDLAMLDKVRATLDKEAQERLEKKLMDKERLARKKIRKAKFGANYNGRKGFNAIADKVNNAEIYDIGAAAVIYIAKNVQFAPQANYRFGRYWAEGYSGYSYYEYYSDFHGFSFPLLFQFSSDYRRKAAFYAESGAGLELLGNGDESIVNASVIAGIGVAFGRCVHLDIARISLGTAYYSLTLGSVRVVF